MRSFADSHAVFFDAIAAKGAERAAADSGCTVREGKVVIPIAGIEYALDPAARTVSPACDGAVTPAGFLESVVAVTYLARADGTPISGDWVSEKQLELGELYFRAQHKLPTHKLAARFARDPEGFAMAAEALGGRKITGADVAVEIPALPRVPIRFSLWMPDDEFPEPDVRTLFDRTASIYLIQDGILTLSNIVVKRMLETRSLEQT